MNTVTDMIVTKQGFPGGSDGEESACNAGDLASISGLGRSPGEGHGNPLQCSCLENPHGQRSLEGCSPWGRKESDTTEQLSNNNNCWVQISARLLISCMAWGK